MCWDKATSWVELSIVNDLSGVDPKLSLSVLAAMRGASQASKSVLAVSGILSAATKQSGLSQKYMLVQGGHEQYTRDQTAEQHTHFHERGALPFQNG